MKLLIGLLFSLFSLTTYAGTPLYHQTDKPVKQHGRLHVGADGELKNEKGEAVRLLGVSLGWHCFHPRFYTKGAIKTLVKDWKADVVRAAMGIDPKNAYKDNPDFATQCVETVVEAAIKNDIYVIIDWHSHEMYTEEAKAFFSKMAQKYGKYPHVIYELYNEPIDDSWESLKVYHKTIIDEIRKFDPDNIILCGCPHWDQDIDKVAASPIEGVSNVMYTVHFYSATHKEDLMKRVENTLTPNVLPIFISECAGMEATGDGPIDEKSWEKWKDLMRKYNLSTVCWSLSDKDETCSMLYPTASSNGKWDDNDLKPWARMVRELMRENKLVWE